MTQTELPSPTSAILRKVLSDIQSHIQAGGEARAVFDLDSTLFDVRPRIIKIIQEFSIDSEMRKKYPFATGRLQSIQELRHSYYIQDHMQELGLEQESESFFKDIYAYWKYRFFHNEYVIHDEPVVGAVDFVTALHSLGVHIIYLTGRDIPRMQKGTIESLKQWKFPIDTPLSELVLKPHFSMDDAEFKRDHFLAQRDYKIWFFENEPVNIQLVLKDCPEVQCIFFDSIHMGKAEEPRHLPTIVDFKI